MTDKINPDHYKKAPLESIEYIEHQLGPNFKYSWSDRDWETNMNKV